MNWAVKVDYVFVAASNKKLSDLQYGDLSKLENLRDERLKGNHKKAMDKYLVFLTRSKQTTNVTSILSFNLKKAPLPFSQVDVQRLTLNIVIQELN